MNLPSIHDIRWKVLAVQLGLISFALLWPGFTRTPQMYLAAFAGSVFTDIIFIRMKNIKLFPLSGIITATAILLLVDSRYIWIYLLIGITAALSKHFIRISKRHIFVPNIFAITLALILLQPYMTVSLGRWGGGSILYTLVASCGVYLSFKARRLSLSLSFILTFILGAFARSVLMGSKLLTLLAPLSGTAFPLFSFYILTDPAVTPKTRQAQIYFGIFTGITDMIIRIFEIKYSSLFALMISCATYALIEELFPAFIFSINPHSNLREK